MGQKRRNNNVLLHNYLFHMSKVVEETSPCPSLTSSSLSVDQSPSKLRLCSIINIITSHMTSDSNGSQTSQEVRRKDGFLGLNIT